ncbi:hypothetical protein [Agromyces sp. Soil535]|uniref:hypothetical protein n=1 Tax=Agromyces sp. Soil535 TaxID=1736390 RepID=UPI0006F21023|nr:hypothetical protein [Agromyces sp. Soil535]KRE29410.1 hypothetical protein ASG80_19900 [Agromyces sp. Soil535]
MKRTTLPAAVAATSAVLLLGTAAPAVAEGPPVIDHFVEVEDFIAQERFPEWCAGVVQFDVAYHAETVGTFHFGQRGSGLWYGGSSYQRTEVYTNVENAKTYTFVFRGSEQDAKVVDNGDGTLTLTIKSVGSEEYFGPDGTSLFHDRGQYSFGFLVDHGGTPDDPSDDTDVADGFLGFGPEHGRFDTHDRDFCADIVEFLS